MHQQWSVASHLLVPLCYLSASVVRILVMKLRQCTVIKYLSEVHVGCIVHSCTRLLHAMNWHDAAAVGMAALCVGSLFSIWAPPCSFLYMADSVIPVCHFQPLACVVQPCVSHAVLASRRWVSSSSQALVCNQHLVCMLE